jgi:GT2 family glycosyltransferase
LVEPSFVKPDGHELIPGKHAIQADFGRDPDTFPWDAWNRFAADNRENRQEPGGLYMPCVLHRETFLDVGGYPHGNVNGISGDVDLFARMEARGFKHVTCFDSLVYHMQEGEMRHK